MIQNQAIKYIKEVFKFSDCKKYINPQWEPGFFDFKSVKNCPDFTQYRHELENPKEDPLHKHITNPNETFPRESEGK